MNHEHDPPLTLAQFQKWIEDRYTRVCELRECPSEIDIMEDVSYQAEQCANHATYFGYPESISVPDLMTPVEALRMMGKLLVWVRNEKFNESPFLTVDEAAVYLRTKPESVYRAVESRQLNCGKVGKELRFTRNQLNQYASEVSAPVKSPRRRRGT